LAPMKSTIPNLRFKISPLQFLLLVQLEASPKYGYEMLKSIKEEFEGVWELKTGTLYPALRSLEKRGLLETQTQEGVDFYHITDKGRIFLQQIGLHQETQMRFSSRFLTAMAKWMSPELKRHVLNSVINLANEDINILGGAIIMINDGVDKQTKLLFLKKLQANLSTRVTKLEDLIREIENNPD